MQELNMMEVEQVGGGLSIGDAVTVGGGAGALAGIVVTNTMTGAAMGGALGMAIGFVFGVSYGATTVALKLWTGEIKLD